MSLFSAMKTSFNLPLLLELADKCPPICLHTESCVQGRFQREVPKSHIYFPLLFKLKKKKTTYKTNSSDYWF